MSGLSLITKGILSETNTVQLEQVKAVTGNTTVELDSFDLAVEIEKFEINVEVCNT